FRALRSASTAPPAAALTAYDRAADHLQGSGMPGLCDGLLPLARLSVAVRHGAPLPAGRHTGRGPYEPWVRPLLLAAEGREADARAALRDLPAPPRDLMSEALWCLAARAAVAVDDPATMLRARAQLLPAAGEQAAGSGLLTPGPVSDHLETLAEALERGGHLTGHP
ncbi:SARP family transcriptional regulator, partial [Streptomyces sp. G35A]